MSGPAPNVLATGRFLRLVAQGHWEYAERTTASGAVAIVAVTEARRLVLVEQFRIPLGCRVIELPAGLAGDVAEDAALDPAIALANAARRELLEETGYEAAEMRHLAEGPTSAGLTNEIVSFFHATGLRRVGDGGGDEHEAITVHEPPVDELDQWLAARVAAGAAVDPKIYSGLYLIRRELAQRRV
jgi:ADP-ribose pyrophosphatase